MANSDKDEKDLIKKMNQFSKTYDPNAYDSFLKALNNVNQQYQEQKSINKLMEAIMPINIYKPSQKEQNLIDWGLKPQNDTPGEGAGLGTPIKNDLIQEEIEKRQTKIKKENNKEDKESFERDQKKSVWLKDLAFNYLALNQAMKTVTGGISDVITKPGGIATTIENAWKNWGISPKFLMDFAQRFGIANYITDINKSVETSGRMLSDTQLALNQMITEGNPIIGQLNKLGLPMTAYVGNGGVERLWGAMLKKYQEDVKTGKVDTSLFSTISAGLHLPDVTRLLGGWNTEFKPSTTMPGIETIDKITKLAEANVRLNQAFEKLTMLFTAQVSPDLIKVIDFLANFINRHPKTGETTLAGGGAGLVGGPIAGATIGGLLGGPAGIAPGFWAGGVLGPPIGMGSGFGIGELYEHSPTFRKNLNILTNPKTKGQPLVTNPKPVIAPLTQTFNLVVKTTESIVDTVNELTKLGHDKVEIFINNGLH